MSDEAASYLTVAPGTPVVDRFGEPVGKLERVLTLSGPFFDGIVISTRAGSRFVDAPEVRRIDADVVELSITAADCEATDHGRYQHVYQARWGRAEITETDRREVIDALKAAYVADLLTADELADRCEDVYEAKSFDELDRLVPQR